MSFGKRTASSQDKHRSGKRAPVQMRGADRGRISAGDLVIGATAVLVAFLGSYFVLGTFFSTGSMSAPTTTAAATVSATDPTPVARTYNKRGTVPFIMNASWMMTLKMHETPEGFDGIDSELHEQCMKSTSKAAAAYAEKRGETFLKPERGAEFLACSMRIYKSRFCEDDYHQRLVARLSEFVRARREHLATVEKIHDTNLGRMVIEVDQASKKNSDGITSGYRPSEFVPSTLGGQIRALSDAGYISQEDFAGLFSTVPEELKPYLKAEAGTSPCG